MAYLNRRSTTIGISLAILIILALPPSFNAAAQTDQPVGSEWIYNFKDEMPGVVFSGKWTYTCERITSTSLGGTEREVVEYKSTLFATASISPLESGSVEGEVSEIGTEYYELETDHLVGHVYNRALTLNASVIGLGSINMDSAVRNETYYLSPGGTGTDPSSIFPGDTWQRSYAKHSESIGRNGDEYFSEESTYNVTISYEFVGFETVSVPAGDFDCVKVRMLAPDGTEEEAWYSYSIVNYVKITDTSGSETTTYELDSYKMAHAAAEPAEMASNLFLAIFFIFIVATIIAAIYASLTLKGKKPPEFQTLQADSPEKDIYRP